MSDNKKSSGGVVSTVAGSALKLVKGKVLLIILAVVLVVFSIILLIGVFTTASMQIAAIPYSSKEMETMENTMKGRYFVEDSKESLVRLLVYHFFEYQDQGITNNSSNAIASRMITIHTREVTSYFYDFLTGETTETIIEEPVGEVIDIRSVMQEKYSEEDIQVALQLEILWLQFMGLSFIDDLPSDYVVSNSKYTYPAPTARHITSRYGQRWGRMHYGVDISDADAVGLPIVAAADGTISEVNTKIDHACGIYIRITHDDASQTRYCHLSSVVVQKGDYVMKGALIGGMGNTGRSTGPHLHFELKIAGKIVDPLPYIIGSKPQ